MSIKKVIFTFLIPLSAFAGVNLKNGNFYITYNDIVVPGDGEELKLSRTYNSKCTELGLNGFGWGTEFETSCQIGADGTVTVYENGCGAQTRFTPKTEIDAKAAASKIVDAMRAKSPLADDVAKNLIEKLSKDAELRLSYSKKFDVKSSLPAGTVLYSTVRGAQEFKINTDGYERTFADGKVEKFNLECKISQIVNKNGYKVDFTYKDKQLISIKDSTAKQLSFSWYPDGLMKASWSVGDKKAEYKYSNQDLVESVDVAGNKFLYTYDSNHNLTSITYSDKSQMKIGYNPKTQFAEEVIERDGEKTKYEYASNPKNPDLHYWTTVTKTEPGGGNPLVSKFEYENKLRNDGSQYTHRIVTELNGVKTDTIYSECCSLPLKITRGKDVTTFEYNQKGLLTKKASTKGDFVQLEYHPEHNKITRVVNNEGWTNFEYDKKANLSKAVNNEGKSVLLVYDHTSKITKMVDFEKATNKKRALDFKYNALGKPVEISMEKVGTINVDYNNYGEVEKVKSKAGPEMALQVTQAFQSLLTIVKPAGVNLNM